MLKIKQAKGEFLPDKLPLLRLNMAEGIPVGQNYTVGEVNIEK